MTKLLRPATREKDLAGTRKQGRIFKIIVADKMQDGVLVDAKSKLPKKL